MSALEHTNRILMETHQHGKEEVLLAYIVGLNKRLTALEKQFSELIAAVNETKTPPTSQGKDEEIHP